MNQDQAAAKPVTALVLAASRRGTEDPVARLQGKSHKCLVEVDGVAMIERVIEALVDSGCCGRILVSIESADTLRQLPRLAGWLDRGVIEVVPSAANLADSVLHLAGAGDPPRPLLITTADNALHTPELVGAFVSESLTGTRDISVGVTREQTVRAEFADQPLGFFRFRDGGYSFCNLFVLHTARSYDAVGVFRSGGQFRKRPWRILKAFGALNLLCYRLRISTLEASLRRVSRNLGIEIGAVEVPWPFAPIDVDNPTTLALSEKILRQRRAAK